MLMMEGSIEYRCLYIHNMEEETTVVREIDGSSMDSWQGLSSVFGPL